MSTNVVVAGKFARPRPASPSVPRRFDGGSLATGAAVLAVVMLPVLRPSGPANVAPVDAFTILGVLGVLFWAGNSRQRLRLPYALAVGLILIGGALGALSGPIPRSGAVALAQDVMLLLWFWALINLVSTPARLRIILGAWALSAIGWAVVLLGSLAAGMDAIAGVTEREGSRTALTFGDPNLAANYFAVSIMVLWAAGYPRHLGLRLTGYGVLLAALATTGSNSGIVSVAVGATVAGLLGAYRRAGFVPAITMLAFVALAGSFVVSNISLADVQAHARGSSYAFIRDGIGRSEKTTSDRGVLLRQGIDLYQSGEVVGSGPVSTKVRLQEEMAPRAKEAHNDYLAAVNERGVLGLVGVFLLVVGLGVQALRLAVQPVSERSAHVVARPNALAGAIAGTLIAMTVTELLHVRHIWTLFALVVAAAALARR